MSFAAGSLPSITNRAWLPSFWPVKKALGTLSARVVSENPGFSPATGRLSPLQGGGRHNGARNHASGVSDRIAEGRA